MTDPEPSTSSIAALDPSVALDRCADPVEITLDGAALGFIGWSHLGEHAGLHLVADGVTLETLRVGDWAPGLVAVVDASALARDLSLGKLVHDEAYDAAVLAAERAAASYDVAAVKPPLYAGPLAPDWRDTARRGVLPAVLGLGFIVVPLVTGLLEGVVEGRDEALMMALVCAALGAAFMLRGLGFLRDSARARAIEGPGASGRPALAQLTRKAIIREWSGSSCALTLKLRVVEPGRAPYPATIRARVAEDRVHDLAEGRWIWIHVGDDEIVFDREQTSDRAATAPR